MIKLFLYRSYHAAPGLLQKVTGTYLSILTGLKYRHRRGQPSGVLSHDANLRDSDRDTADLKM
jgi:hypothetical protein